METLATYHKLARLFREELPVPLERQGRRRVPQDQQQRQGVLPGQQGRPRKGRPAHRRRPGPKRRRERPRRARRPKVAQSGNVKVLIPSSVTWPEGQSLRKELGG